MHITSGSVTALIDNLERKDYIKRLTDPGDRRRILVDITPKAQKVLDQMLPEVQQLSRTLLEPLGATAQQALLDTLGQVRVALADLPTDLPPPKPRKRPKHLTR